MLGSNRRYVNLSPYGEPQLGRRGLYRSAGGAVATPDDERALLWVLNAERQRLHPYSTSPAVPGSAIRSSDGPPSGSRRRACSSRYPARGHPRGPARSREKAIDSLASRSSRGSPSPFCSARPAESFCGSRGMGPIILSLSSTHGLDAGDLPAARARGACRRNRPRQPSRSRRSTSSADGRVLGPAPRLGDQCLASLLIVALVDYDRRSPPCSRRAAGPSAASPSTPTDHRPDPVDRWSHLAVTYDGTRGTPVS